jgi:hypothetical protein
MALVVQLVTFTGTAAAQVAPPSTYVKKIIIEPARANADNMFVGNSSLTQTGSAGLIADLAKPGSGMTVVLDQFVVDAQGSSHNYDASDLWIWGTTADVAKVTYWTI